MIGLLNKEEGVFSIPNEDEAIRIAKVYGLENEIKELIEEGFTPEEALREYDL